MFPSALLQVSSEEHLSPLYQLLSLFIFPFSHWAWSPTLTYFVFSFSLHPSSYRKREANNSIASSIFPLFLLIQSLVLKIVQMFFLFFIVISPVSRQVFFSEEKPQARQYVLLLRVGPQSQHHRLLVFLTRRANFRNCNMFSHHQPIGAVPHIHVAELISQGCMSLYTTQREKTLT